MGGALSVAEGEKSVNVPVKGSSEPEDRIGCSLLFPQSPLLLEETTQDLAARFPQHP